MRVYLRPITKEDGSKIVKWRNSIEVMSHCFNRTPVTLESNSTFFSNNIETGKYKQFIVERVDDDYGVLSYPIATVYLKDIDKINNRCELCVFTSNDEEWNTDSQSIAIKLLLDKAFDEYKMHKVYSYVYSANLDEVKLLEKSGFKLEATLKDEGIDMNGNYVNVFRMAIFRME